jgi:ABC-type Fe3+-hydroxamate transport system substrate-binding protein
MGETQVCGQPQKIVALSPHLLDLLLSLDHQPAGYAEVFPFHKGKYFDNPSQQIPYLGDRVTSQPINLGNRNEPSLERLIKLKPDLILGEVETIDKLTGYFRRLLRLYSGTIARLKGNGSKVFGSLPKLLETRSKPRLSLLPTISESQQLVLNLLPSLRLIRICYC